MTYFQDRSNDSLLKMRKILQEELPNFCGEFFVGISNNTSPLTRLGYARDLSLFFNYICNNGVFNKTAKQFTISDLAQITTTDIELFLEYTSYYKNENGEVFSNTERGKSRKLSTIRSLFKYFYNKNYLDNDVASKVSTPKLHEKEIIRLDNSEIARMISIVDNGNGLTKHQNDFHRITHVRDVAMITLFLGTGIRISECVGLDLNDVDIDNRTFTVTRKGGNRVILYMSEEVASALESYISLRIHDKSAKKDETALFLSIQGKRITPRATQMLVKKYSQIVTPLKHITPHKLRSTFGTKLYNETNDIYVVAEVLGHKDINTTKKHYAAQSEQIRERALKSIKLVDNDEKQDK